MNLYLPKISQLDFGWNERPLGEDDFYNICPKNDIDVIETPMKIRGICWFVDGEHVITINSRLRGHERLFAMWHEFGHFLMHVPNKTVATYFWGDEKIYGENRREENEANAFGLCALIPKIWVETRTLNELVEFEGFSEERVWQRKKVYEKYKL